ncbi:hypothetical protein MBIO_0403 [Mycoplasmopsis fermentans PG18]|uniref:Uncharacterized protein n=3 Tax=Mycoplasmopsis fermentans TaxID=2115 RepID=C4XEU6_MYCFP|nr:relaxase MobL [Mycoplasmopsis fermentans]VEU67533.1 Uncharacterised protein [Mesomycoplasma conjunctivae]AAN85214.1 ICEF-IA ORF3 [Mycoplasmopsis fermentans]ADV34394.1 Hypothetical Protein MfeM64YM_0392 [Mycoplasmopsis fermentans M64]VEU60391.1 Uncharacterised protein [Mycoplasmopsis fermentans]BAH69668.1 hypothetical protein MBIO_0403 [Mycoplasmopsis fermentans PG18]
MDVYMKFNYVSKMTNYKTGLGYCHDLNSWVSSGAVIDYFARGDKCVAFSPFDDSEKDRMLLEEVSREEKINWYRNHLKSKMGSQYSGVYDMLNDSSADVNIDNVKEELKSIDEQTFYEGILNLGDLGLEHNVLTANDWAELVKEEFRNFYSISGFDLDNLSSYYSIHGNTDNPHIHFMFFEKTKKRAKRKLNIDDIKMLRMKITNKLIKNFDYQNLKDLTSKLWDARKDVLSSTEQTLENFQSQDYKDFIEACCYVRAEMENRFNKSYKLASPEVKEAINKIETFLYKYDDDFKGKMDNYQKAFDLVMQLKDETNSTFLKKRINNVLRTEKDEFSRQLGNKIIKAILKSRNAKSAKSFTKLFFYNLNVNDDSWRLINRAKKIFEAQSIQEYENIMTYYKI